MWSAGILSTSLWLQHIVTTYFQYFHIFCFFRWSKKSHRHPRLHWLCRSDALGSSMQGVVEFCHQFRRCQIRDSYPIQMAQTNDVASRNYFRLMSWNSLVRLILTHSSTNIFRRWFFKLIKMIKGSMAASRKTIWTCLDMECDSRMATVAPRFESLIAMLMGAPHSNTRGQNDSKWWQKAQKHGSGHLNAALGESSYKLYISQNLKLQHVFFIFVHINFAALQHEMEFKHPTCVFPTFRCFGGTSMPKSSKWSFGKAGKPKDLICDSWAQESF